MYGEGTWDGSSDYNVWQGVFVKTDENGKLFSAGYGEGEQLNGRDLFVIRTDPNGNELR